MKLSDIQPDPVQREIMQLVGKNTFKMRVGLRYEIDSKLEDRTTAVSQLGELVTAEVQSQFAQLGSVEYEHCLPKTELPEGINLVGFFIYFECRLEREKYTHGVRPTSSFDWTLEEGDSWRDCLDKGWEYAKSETRKALQKPVVPKMSSVAGLIDPVTENMPRNPTPEMTAAMQVPLTDPLPEDALEIWESALASLKDDDALFPHVSTVVMMIKVESESDE